VIPYAEPAYQRLRGALAMDAGAVTRLDGTFGLHPALAQVAKLYEGREALFVHAIASPYRDRSHFDGQNVLETGGAAPYQLKDGWLNRLVATLPGGKTQAVAISPTVPLALRGRAEVSSYAPSALRSVPDELMQRMEGLYAMDEQLHPAWMSAMQARSVAVPAKQDAGAMGTLAARFLSQPDGPRIAMLETGGWDTHSAQVPRLANQLKALDSMIAALRDGLASVWSDTVIVIATEFGRTATANGTGGTDHGTASVAMLLGGAVAGGRVLADWPGLSEPMLHQGRDLRPTTSLCSLIAGAAAECFNVEPQRMAATLFAGVEGSRAMTSLLRAT